MFKSFFVLAFLLCLVTAPLAAHHMTIGSTGHAAWYCTSPEPLVKIIEAKDMSNFQEIINASDCYIFSAAKAATVTKMISTSYDKKLKLNVEIYKIELKHLPSQPAYVAIPVQGEAV